MGERTRWPREPCVRVVCTHGALLRRRRAMRRVMPRARRGMRRVVRGRRRRGMRRVVRAWPRSTWLRPGQGRRLRLRLRLFLWVLLGCLVRLVSCWGVGGWGCRLLFGVCLRGVGWIRGWCRCCRGWLRIIRLWLVGLSRWVVLCMRRGWTLWLWMGSRLGRGMWVRVIW